MQLGRKKQKGGCNLHLVTRAKPPGGFFTGAIANKVLEYVKECPIWMVKGTVRNKNVLIAVDNSKNAMRAVDQAGFMLSGTDVMVTVFHYLFRSRNQLSHQAIAV